MAFLGTCQCRSTCSSRDDRAVEAGRAVEPDVLVRVRTDVHERLLPEVKHVATLGLPQPLR
jgi:hypothetical protein